MYILDQQKLGLMYITFDDTGSMDKALKFDHSIHTFKMRCVIVDLTTGLWLSFMCI